MKKIVCEMCNGTDILKQDGVYVCQNCGMKYSSEDAHKLIVEVSGGVNSRVSVNLENARAAKNREEWAEAEKYYGLEAKENPSDVEATFYRVYSAARQTLLNEDLFKRQEAFKSLAGCISLVGADLNPAVNEGLIRQINQDIHGIASDRYVYNITKDGYGNAIDDDRNETENLFLMLFLAMNNAITELRSKGDAKYLYELLGLNYRRLLLEPLNSLLTDNYRSSISAELAEIDARLSEPDTSIAVRPMVIDLSNPKKVTFGRWQGYPLEWTVACQVGEMVCLFCNTCIAKMMVDTNLFVPSITGTRLYNWLISDFVNNAFMGEERQRVMPPLIKYPNAANIPLCPNVAVFIPTIAELKTFEFEAPANIMGTRSRAWWWTASTRRHRGRTLFVDVDPAGRVSTGHYANDTRISVRPMVWVYIGQ